MFHILIIYNALLVLKLTKCFFFAYCKIILFRAQTANNPETPGHTNRTCDLKPFLKVNAFFIDQKFRNVQIFVSFSDQIAGRSYCITSSKTSINIRVNNVVLLL